nr:hypothetical protein AUSP0088_00061 [uncultured phage]
MLEIKCDDFDMSVLKSRCITGEMKPILRNGYINSELVDLTSCEDQEVEHAPSVHGVQ